jgi:hypothetical protein
MLGISLSCNTVPVCFDLDMTNLINRTNGGRTKE